MGVMIAMTRVVFLTIVMIGMMRVIRPISIFVIKDYVTVMIKFVCFYDNHQCYDSDRSEVIESMEKIISVMWKKVKFMFP